MLPHPLPFSLTTALTEAASFSQKLRAVLFIHLTLKARALYRSYQLNKHQDRAIHVQFCVDFLLRVVSSLKTFSAISIFLY